MKDARPSRENSPIGSGTPPQMRTAANDPTGGVSKGAKLKAWEARGIENRTDELGLGLGAGARMNVAAGWFGNWLFPQRHDAA